MLNPATPYKEGPVLSHSPPLQLDWGLSRSGPNTAQLSTLPSRYTRSLWVYHLHGFTTLSLFPSLRLQASRSLSVLLKPYLAGERAVNSALSQESCSMQAGAGLGLQSPWSTLWPQGPFSPETIPLPSVFSVSSILFGLLSS